MNKQNAEEYLAVMSAAHPGPVIAVTCRDAPPSTGDPWGQVHGLPVVHLDRSWAFRPHDAEAVALSYNLGPELAREYLRLKRGEWTEEEVHDLCHNLHCADEQRKLYGAAPDADALRRVVGLLREAKDAVCHVGDVAGAQLQSPSRMEECDADCLACRIDAELARHETPC